jgi:2,3-dihydroxy-p-cumate/2,3-dihydroxybenzoate 3,4-dioxygenase
MPDTQTLTDTATYPKLAANYRHKGIGYVALNVTDVERTMEFATTTFALDPAGSGPSGERFLRANREHHSVVLYPAKEPAFVRLGLELESEDDVGRAFSHMQALGLKPKPLAKEERDVLGLNLSAAFRVREPMNSLCFEYYSSMLTVSRPRINTATKFIKLAHVGINTPKVKESTSYLVDNLGFIVSDVLGDWMGMLGRPFPVADHHGFGYLPSRTGKPGFNHLAFSVESIDDIGKFFNRVDGSSVPRAFGMGRHPTSSGVHLYVNDPDGMLWEYTLGMEQFPETGARPARFMSVAPEDYDLWGAKPKPSFAGAGGVIAHDE